MSYRVLFMMSIYSEESVCLNYIFQSARFIFCFLNLEMSLEIPPVLTKLNPFSAFGFINTAPDFPIRITLVKIKENYNSQINTGY